MKEKQLYGDDFYKNRNEKTAHAAEIVLTIVNNIFPFTSVVDVGCGIGTWLAISKKICPKMNSVYGIDGDYVNRDMLVIDKSEFHSQNLEERIVIDKKFDLAITLEVAEHLTVERADTFAEDLTKLSDVVLFSAAPPCQPGTAHINCQLLSYWNEKFKKFGYQIFDIIRPEIWNDKSIPVWYRQNIVVFVNKNSKYYQEFCDIERKPILDIIHPDEYESHDRLLSSQISDLRNSKAIKIARKIGYLLGKR